jgi:hypothetical protein
MGRAIYEVKNPGLYSALKRMCGKVEVSQAGETATYQAVRKTALDLGSGKDPPIWDVKGGERYIVKCPFCRRDKLWVSYLAGCSMESKNGLLNFSRGLIICYRCRFNEDPLRRDIFWRRLEENGYDEKHRSVREAQTAEVQYSSVEESSAAEVVLPPMVSLKKGHCPDRVLDYLLNTRGIDPDDLSLHTGCGWSDHPAWATDPVGRLIFPVWQNRNLVGWQGRALDEDMERIEAETGKKVPKYYFSAGSHKERWLYNLDIARWCPIGVLVEGVIDVYKVGQAGVGRFGCTVHASQLKLLKDIWGNRGVVYMPDGDDPRAIELGQNYVQQWNLRGLFKDGAHLCIPPKGLDPGAMPHANIVHLIKQQTGIDIP